MSLALHGGAQAHAWPASQRPSAMLTGVVLALAVHGLALWLWPAPGAQPRPQPQPQRAPSPSPRPQLQPQVLMLRLLPAPPVAAPTTGLPLPQLLADKAVAGRRQATPAVAPKGLGNTQKRPVSPAAAMDPGPAQTPGAVPSPTDAPDIASRSEPSAAPGNAARPLDLRWRGANGGGASAGPSGAGPRLPTPSPTELAAPPSQRPEARLARALDPGAARSEQRLAGEGRTRVRIGRDCLDVKDARSTQLDPFNQSHQNTPRLVSDCSR